MSEENVISIKHARAQKNKERCQHSTLLIDEDLTVVECNECGAQLNPIAMLRRFADAEVRHEKLLEEIALRKADLKNYERYLVNKEKILERKQNAKAV